MLRTPTVVFGLLIAGLVAGTAARAEAPAAASTAPAEESWILKNGRASYTLEMLGMRTEALNGNVPCPKAPATTTLACGSTNLLFNHYLAIGAKLGAQTSLKLTQPASQSIDEKSEAQKRHWVYGDPYMTFSYSGLLKSEAYAFNLDTYVRYYFPIGMNTNNNRNKGFGTTAALNEGFAPPVDNGRGRMRLYFQPSKSWLDGALTLNGTFFANFFFNSQTPQERFDNQVRENAHLVATGKPASIVPKSYRQDMYFVFDPTLNYAVSSKVELYIEWTTGILRHSTEGKWSSIKDDPGYNAHYFSYGVNWSPTKKISVNPYLTYQLAAPAQDRGFDKQDIGLTVGYAFL